MTTISPPLAAGEAPFINRIDRAFAEGLLGDVPAAVRRRVERSVEIVEVRGGEVVLREGEHATAAYVLLRGRLRVMQAGIVRAEIAAGEMFGELALLTDAPRNATVTAVRDSALLMLPAAAFQAAAESHPDVLLRVCRAILDRAARAERKSTTTVATVALVAAGVRPPRLTECGRALVRALNRFGPTTIVAGRSATRYTDSELTAHLDQLERDHRFVVYLADGTDSAWTQRCLRQADRILLVGATGSPAGLGPAERAAAGAVARSELLLLDGAGPPTGTSAWLSARPHVVAHHHIRASSDYARVARAVAGERVGLVLGGGGPRGFAHLGVVRALESAGIPIDAVGGTSAGAVMAAGIAAGWDDETRRARAAAIFAKRKDLIDLTLPIVALTAGRKVTRMLQSPRGFGDLEIENLPLPFFAIAADLTSAQAMVLDRGPVWHALRASTAQPGVFPPVWDAGRLLVDGGVVDDLPVSTMRERLDGTVIAVALQPVTPATAVDAFPAALSGWRVLADRMLPRRAPAAPGLVSLLLQAKEVGGRRAMRAALENDPPELLLHPPTGDVDPLDFRHSDDLIEAGYRYASEMLARSSVAARIAGL